VRVPWPWAEPIRQRRPRGPFERPASVMNVTSDFCSGDVKCSPRLISLPCLRGRERLKKDRREKPSADADGEQRDEAQDAVPHRGPPLV
jgi:hypothetical protein